MTVASSGTGTITLGAAVTGFLTFDLSGCSTASTGQVLVYSINDIPASNASEIATGTYFSSSITLTRGSSTTGMKSTNGNSPINMSASAQVMITPAAYTFQSPTTQSFLSSSGSYVTPANATWLESRGKAGGGGGGAGNTATLATSGATTTFGPFTANGGGGAGNLVVGAGGTASGGLLNLTGASGSGGTDSFTGTFNGTGGTGGGHGGAGGVNGNVGNAAAANTGGGGGGGCSNGLGTTLSGAGGGEGGEFYGILSPPSSGYSYVVGPGGAGTTTGSSEGASGAAGGSGWIIVVEHYD